MGILKAIMYTLLTGIVIGGILAVIILGIMGRFTTKVNTDSEQRIQGGPGLNVNYDRRPSPEAEKTKNSDSNSNSNSSTSSNSGSNVVTSSVSYSSPSLT